MDNIDLVDYTFTTANYDLVLDASFSGSAVIAVEGMFTGTLSVYGSGNHTIYGKRTLYKSGVGSLGTNVITNAGSSLSREYFIISSGDKIKISSGSPFTGSARVRIYAVENTPIVYVNGPVHNSFEEAVRDGRGYSVSTSVQSANTGDYIKYTFYNPTDSGKNVFINLREFITNSVTSVNELQFLVTPTELSTSNITPNNLKSGGTASTVRFRTQVNTVSLGTPSGTQLLSINGIPNKLDTLRLLQPGEGFGYQIAGAGGSLPNALRASNLITWYEEVVN